MPYMLSRGQNQESAPVIVLLSIAQGMARLWIATPDTRGDGNGNRKALNEFAGPARRDPSISVVVDEAHSGLDKDTEVRQIRPLGRVIDRRLSRNE